MDDNDDADMLALDGSISLSGFKDIDRAVLIDVKKLVGSYARKFSDQLAGFQRIHVNLKKVHAREKSEIYELQGRLTVDGKTHAVESEDRNLFSCLGSVLRKLETLVQKE